MNRNRSNWSLVLLGLVVVGAGLLWWTLPRPLEIVDAKRSEDGRYWVAYVERCNSDRSVEVRENEAAVVVIVRADRGVNADCLDAVNFELDQPLGDRVIVDGSDFSLIEARVSDIGAGG